jgi:hypothetical protein
MCAGECAGGRCLTTLATGQSGAAGLAVDAANVYWVASTPGTVMQVPSAGGTPITLASGQTSASFIAIDATNVYFTNTSAGTVVKVPIGGGTVTTLASGQSSPTNVAVGAGGVYWLSGGNTVNNVATTGGTPTQFMSGGVQYQGLAVDSQYAYFSEFSGGSYPYAFVELYGLFQESFPWESMGTGDAVAVDSTYVYFTAESTQSVIRGTKGSLPTGMVIAVDSVAETHRAIAADGSKVYFTCGCGQIVEVGTDGSNLVILASNQGDSSGIGVDAAYVYWTNPTTGSIVKTAK